MFFSFRPFAQSVLSVALLGAPLVPPALAESPSGEARFEIHREAGEAPLPGVQPRPGESEAELNRRLLESFGKQPYGPPESAAQRARRDELHERLTREAREELLFNLEARSMKRALEGAEAEVDPALIPSRRFVTLSRTLKVPQMLRDRLEEEVQQGRLSPYDLYDAEQGFFDPTRRDLEWNEHSGPVHYGRSLPSRAIVQDLLTYQNYLRAQRYAKYYE